MHREYDERAWLLSYLKGNRRGREAHDLERKAMQDSFLADALDGYDNTGDSELTDRLCRMEESVRLRSVRRNGITVTGGLRDIRPPMPMQNVMYESACETGQNIPDAVPQPVGGYRAYYEYIYDRLAAADPDGSESGGVIVLNFTVDETGRPHNFKVVESPSPGVAEAIIRIIDSGPAWTCAGEVEAFTVTLRR